MQGLLKMDYEYCRNEEDPDKPIKIEEDKSGVSQEDWEALGPIEDHKYDQYEKKILFDLEEKVNKMQKHKDTNNYTINMPPKSVTSLYKTWFYVFGLTTNVSFVDRNSLKKLSTEIGNNFKISLAFSMTYTQMK